MAKMHQKAWGSPVHDIQTLELHLTSNVLESPESRIKNLIDEEAPESRGLLRSASAGSLSPASRPVRVTLRSVERSPKMCPNSKDRLSGFGGSLRTGSIPRHFPDKLRRNAFHSSSSQMEANIATRQKKRLRDVLQDVSVVHRIIQGKLVGDLQIAMGEKSPDAVHAGLELLHAENFQRARYLLSAQADPLTRGSDGSVALHHALGCPETVRLLLKAEPTAARIKNWVGETPLEFHIRTDHHRLRQVLHEWRDHFGPGIFFQIGKDGRTLCEQLHIAELKPLKLMPDWAAIDGALLLSEQRSDVRKILAYMQELRETQGDSARGVIRFYLFEDEDWRNHHVKHKRLHCLKKHRLYWKLVEVLFRGSCQTLTGHGDLSEEERQQCKHMTTFLLQVVGGVDCGEVFAEGRAEFAMCVGELQEEFHNKIGDARYLLKHAPEPEEREAWAWLHGRAGPPLDKMADGVEVPHGNHLRMDLNLPKAADFQPLQVPSWVHTHDLDAALTNLEELGAELDADTLLSQGLEKPREFFAWLHSHFLWALCRNTSGEAYSLMRSVFDRCAHDAGDPEIHFRPVFDSSSPIWESAHTICKEDIKLIEKETKKLQKDAAEKALFAEQKAAKLSEFYEAFKDDGVFREMYHPQVMNACRKDCLETYFSSAKFFASQLAAGKFKDFSLRMSIEPDRETRESAQGSTRPRSLRASFRKTMDVITVPNHTPIEGRRRSAKFETSPGRLETALGGFEAEEKDAHDKFPADDAYRKDDPSSKGDLRLGEYTRACSPSKKAVGGSAYTTAGPYEAAQENVQKASSAFAFDVLRLEEVPSQLTSRDLHKVLCNRQGFLGVWLERSSKANPRALRKGFAWFENEVSAALAGTFLRNIQLWLGSCLRATVERFPTQPVRFVPREMSHPDRIKTDLSLATQVIRILDRAAGVTSDSSAATDSITEKIQATTEDVEMQLDISILYLQKVHGFCFYSALHCDSPFELFQCTGAAAFVRHADAEAAKLATNSYAVYNHESSLIAFIRAHREPKKLLPRGLQGDYESRMGKFVPRKVYQDR